MKNILRGSAVLLIAAIIGGCMSSGASVKQMGASNKKVYHKSKVPNARSGKKYKTGL